MITYDTFCQQLSTNLLLDLDPLQKYQITITDYSKDCIRFQFFVKQSLMNTSGQKILFKCLICYNASYSEPQLHLQMYAVNEGCDETLDDAHEDEFTLENELKFQSSCDSPTEPELMSFSESLETMKFINISEFHHLLQSPLSHGIEQHVNNYFHQIYHFPLLLDSLSSGEIFYSVQNCDSHEIVGGGNIERFSVNSTDQQENKGKDQHHLVEQNYLKRWISVYVLPILRDLCAVKKN